MSKSTLIKPKQKYNIKYNAMGYCILVLFISLTTKYESCAKKNPVDITFITYDVFLK